MACPLFRSALSSGLTSGGEGTQQAGRFWKDGPRPRENVRWQQTSASSPRGNYAGRFFLRSGMRGRAVGPVHGAFWPGCARPCRILRWREGLSRSCLRKGRAKGSAGGRDAGTARPAVISGRTRPFAAGDGVEKSQRVKSSSLSPPRESRTGRGGVRFRGS